MVLTSDLLLVFVLVLVLIGLTCPEAICLRPLCDVLPAVQGRLVAKCLCNIWLILWDGMRWHSDVCNEEHLEVLHDLPHVFDRHDEDAEQKLY